MKNLCPAPKNNASMETTRVKVAVYFEPDQSVITKITKDAKMTWSDKISWVGEEKTIRILIFFKEISRQFVIKERDIFPVFHPRFQFL